MLTRSAAATTDFVRHAGVGVYPAGQLVSLGCTRSTLRARLAADRWRRIGQAVVLHNGELTREERWAVAVLNCGPRAVLASLSAAESLGLQGWEREEIHVLAPAGVPRPRIPGLPVILHRARVVDPAGVLEVRRCQRIAPALVLAATAFRSPRSGCGVLVAGVQQRLVVAPELRSVLAAAPNARNRRLLLAAVDDIAMGAQALSEIDFVRLCRRHRLPRPRQQAVRIERTGRRRFLDAEWVRADGRRVAAEVDGALHLAPKRWWDDQLRQNEVVLSRTMVLRFPSAVLRADEALVVDQLSRALFDEW